LLEGINILVAEDNILNQKIVNFILQKQHATVKTVSNGKEVIDLLRESHFDLVLMDLHMPVMDGFETARYIRTEMKSNIPVVAITADMFAGETPECVEAGMNACISKPINGPVLCELIVSLVAK